jgi:hypothetical protein
VSGSDDRPRPPIGWPRAILSGTAIALVGILGVAYAPHLIVTKVTGVTGTPLSLLAAGTAFAVVGVMAWALRRLQRRGVI